MSKRAPRHPLSRLAAGIDKQGTGGARSIANAFPVADYTNAVGEAQAGAVQSVGGESAPWMDEDFVLAADGAQTVTLAFLPLALSEDVKLNGLGQLRGTDWSRTGQTVSVLAAMDARTGQTLTVHYQYLSGVPALPEEGTPDLGPYITKVWIQDDLTGTLRVWFKIERWFDRDAGSVAVIDGQFYTTEGPAPTSFNISEAPEVGAKAMKGQQTSAAFVSARAAGVDLFQITGPTDLDTLWPGWRTSDDYNDGGMWENGDVPTTISESAPPAGWGD